MIASGLARLPPTEREAFRTLRASLRYFNVDRPVTSVLITSCAPGEGKSTVATYLGIAAAEAGTETLLVEADWRHPTIADWLSLVGVPGLSLVLAGDSDLVSAAARVQVTEDDVAGACRLLDVLPAGAPPPNPTDLLDSPQMRELIAHAEREYELVVIDAPSISVVSDAVPLANAVSGVVVVAAVGKTTHESAAELRNRLKQLGAPVFGVVPNFIRGTQRYDYRETDQETRDRTALRAEEPEEPAPALRVHPASPTPPDRIVSRKRTSAGISGERGSS